MAIQLETDRLFLKQMCAADAPGMFELNSDEEVTRYTGDGAFRDIEQVDEFIRNYDQYEKYKMGRLNIFLKTTGENIGWCGLKFHANENLVDLGYRLHKRHWGKGYATEASIASLNYGFNTLHLAKIIAHAMEANHASIKIMKKLGMQYVKNIELHGEPCVVYELKNTEWK